MRNYCKDCVYCVPIMKHPWNTTLEFKGKTSEQVAFGCISFCIEGINRIIIMDTDDGECEMFLPRGK